jgi:Protein of unknown function (DUF4238)
MGQHYVPQRYLRAFQVKDAPGFICMFDKQSGTWKRLPIKEVAQAGGFYTEQIEDELNRQVEIPGNDIIDKIRRGEKIDDELDRKYLTYYIATMIRRVPYARGKYYEIIPKVLSDTVTEARQFLQRAHHEGRIDPEMLAKRLAELEAFEKKFAVQPPSEVVNVIETPWPFASMLFVIYGMHWRLIKTNGPSRFLTSDNPASFFESFGLQHPECELIFPLCTDLLLHCSWNKCSNMNSPPTRQQLVKEFNRRTAFHAERFLFYHEQADWIRSVARTEQRRLNRINWT